MYRKKTESKKTREHEFLETRTTTHALVYKALLTVEKLNIERHRELCLSRLSGLRLGAFINYPEESDCLPAVRRPKLVTETGLIVRQ